MPHEICRTEQLPRGHQWAFAMCVMPGQANAIGLRRCSIASAALRICVQALDFNFLLRRMMTVQGVVTYNGKPLNKRAKRQVGFVLQVRRR